MPTPCPLLTACHTDRRADPRFTSSLRVVCEVEHANGQPRLMQGSSTNISRRGVAMILPRPLTREDRVLLTLEHPETGYACQRSARPRHGRRVYGGWMTGCEFDEALTESELARLVGAL